MSSGIAAPIGGRFARAKQIEDARKRERRRLRRHLRATVLRPLEELAGGASQASSNALIAGATDVAGSLRATVRRLSEDDGRDPGARLRREVGALLHDTTLQTLEYVASDGYGADLDADHVGTLIAGAATDLRRRLREAGAQASCELVSELRSVVSDARERGLEGIRLVTSGDHAVRGEDASALAGAVREALNNVGKHANATHVLVRCEASEGGTLVTVRDNGVGVDLERASAGIGLRHSICDRITTRGGQARVTSAPGRGTLVTIMTPNINEVAA